MATVKNLVTGEFSEAKRLLPGDNGYRKDEKDDAGNDLQDISFAIFDPPVGRKKGQWIGVTDAEFGRTWTGYTHGDMKALV